MKKLLALFLILAIVTFVSSAFAQEWYDFAVEDEFSGDYQCIRIWANNLEAAMCTMDRIMESEPNMAGVYTLNVYICGPDDHWYESWDYIYGCDQEGMIETFE